VVSPDEPGLRRTYRSGTARAGGGSVSYSKVARQGGKGSVVGVVGVGVGIEEDGMSEWNQLEKRILSIFRTFYRHEPVHYQGNCYFQRIIPFLLPATGLSLDTIIA
jgi:hypothetical protein